jgi:hypothetical protein
VIGRKITGNLFLILTKATDGHPKKQAAGYEYPFRLDNIDAGVKKPRREADMVV